jgi:hypothetical protein
MKSILRNALLAVAAAGVAASAQATYTAGDLLVGFDKSGAQNDFVYDIGGFGSLYDGETWSLGSLLASADPKFATLNDVDFGVVGALSSSKTIYSTTDGTFAPDENLNAFNTLRTGVMTIGYGVGLGTPSGANYGSPAVGSGNDWNSQMVNPPPAEAGAFGNYWNPSAVTPDSFTSPAQAYLYANDNNADPAVASGTFSLASDGTLTYNAVPEPATFTLFAGMGVLALTVRSRLLRKA